MRRLSLVPSGPRWILLLATPRAPRWGSSSCKTRSLRHSCQADFAWTAWASGLSS